MKLLLDEMYPARIAEQLRRAGHRVVSVHEAGHRHLEGAPDADVFEVAVAEGWTVVTENVPDFIRLEAAARAAGRDAAALIFTTDRQFPRGSASTVGRLVRALDAVLSQPSSPHLPHFLRASPLEVNDGAP